MLSRVPTFARRNEPTAAFSIVLVAIQTFLGCVLLAVVAASLDAQGTKDGSTLRALLIGINKYHYPALMANWRVDLEKQWGARLEGAPSKGGAIPVEKRADPNRCRQCDAQRNRLKGLRPQSRGRLHRVKDHLVAEIETVRSRRQSACTGN